MCKDKTVSRISRGSAFILTSMLLGVSLQGRANVLVANTISQDNPPQTTPAPDHARISPAVQEIVRLVDAKIDAEVIKTFIQNSPVAYDPTASDLIALTEHGVSSDILVALLHHGAEMRSRMAQTQPTVYPSTQTVPQTTYPAVSDSYSYPSDSGYYQSYYPNSYYSTGYGWPVYYSAPFFPWRGRPYAHGPGPARGFGGPVRFASAGRPGPVGGHGMSPGGGGRPGPAMHGGGGGARPGGGGHPGGGPAGGGHPGGGGGRR